MGTSIDSVVEIFKKSLSLNAWLYFLVIFAIALAIGLAFSVLLGIFVFFAVVIGVSAPLLLIPVILLAMLAVFPFMMAFVVFMEGMELHFSMRFLQGKSPGIGKALSDAFDRTRERFWAMLGTEVIVTIIKIVALGFIGVVLFVPLALLLAPVFAQLPSTESAGNPAAVIAFLAPVLGWLIVVVAVFSIAVLLVNTLFILSPQVALFEGLGITDSVKRIFDLGKKNFVSNLSFMLVYCIALVVPMAVFFFVVFFPYLGLAGSGFKDPGNAALAFFMLATIASMAFRFVFQIWFSVLGAFFGAKVYSLNVPGGKPPLSRKAKK